MPPVGPLQMNENLRQAAQAHSDDLAQPGVDFGHTGSDGSDFGTRINRTGLGDECMPAGAGENIYGGSYNPVEVVRAWKSSRYGHCTNLMRSSWKYTGIGLAEAANTSRWTQLYADISASCLSTPPPPPPPPLGNNNDVCANATTISCGQAQSGSTTNATLDQGAIGTGYGVWYKFAGNGQRVTLSTQNTGTNFAARLTIYKGSCGQLQNMAYSGTGNIELSEVQQGATYYILLDGNAHARGNYELTMTCVSVNSAPTNDNCNAADDFYCGYSSGTTAYANLDNGCYGEGYGVWYSTTGTGYRMKISTVHAATEFDTRLSVVTGSCYGFSCVAQNDDKDYSAGIYQAEVEFQSEYGVKYYLSLIHI